MSNYLVAGLELTAGSYQECVDLVIGLAQHGDSTHVHFVNAYVIALAAGDSEYGALLNEGICLTDGLPLAWVGRRAFDRSAEEWERVYGPDVMESTLAVPGLRHFLVGGTPQTLEALQVRIATRWPQAQIVGAYSPPFRPMTSEEESAQDGAIRESDAHLVWIGLGTPKQDWEAARIAKSTARPALAVGAAFDFLAGTKPQAPVWMQRSGTEWVFRLATEPRRLAKRYLWGNPRFLLAVAKQPGFRRRGD